jgi:CBS domain-containing protein
VRVCEMSGMPATAAAGPAPDRGALVAHPQQELAEVIAVLRLSGLRSLAVVEDGVVLGTVTEQDLVRALARDDSDIANDIRCRLARHRGLGRWVVTVCGGDVVLTGADPDPVERIAVTAITGSVVGVTGMRFVGHPRSIRDRTLR